MRPIKWIVVHTSATADKSGKPVDASAESIRRYHREHNGWKDIGYHYVIRRDGTIEQGRELWEPGAHVGGFNVESIGICCSGHGDIEDFTPLQHQALANLCAQHCKNFSLPHTVVIGHREADDFGAPHVDKTCPGTKVDMMAVRGRVAAQLTPVDKMAELERRVAALEARAAS